MKTHADLATLIGETDGAPINSIVVWRDQLLVSTANKVYIWNNEVCVWQSFVGLTQKGLVILAKGS